MEREGSDAEIVRDMLSEHFPTLRSRMGRFEQGRLEAFGDLGSDADVVDAWDWLGDFFVRDVLEKGPQGEVEPDRLAGSVAEFLESVVALHRPSIEDILKARVVDYMLGYPKVWDSYRKWCGPGFSELVAVQSQYYRPAHDSLLD